jgi:hypothetical protein
VFTAPGGSVLRLPNWRRSVFMPARRRAGLSDRFRVHDLRHAAASLMIQAAYPPKMLKMRPDDDEGQAGRGMISVSCLVRGGALGGTRTPNLLIRSQMLYPLSYERSQCSIPLP